LKKKYIANSKLEEKRRETNRFSRRNHRNPNNEKTTSQGSEEGVSSESERQEKKNKDWPRRGGGRQKGKDTIEQRQGDDRL